MTAGRCHRQITDGCQLVDSHVEISDTLQLPFSLFLSSHLSHLFFFSHYLLLLLLLWHCEGKSCVLDTCGLFGSGSHSSRMMRHRDLIGFVKRKYTVVLIMLSVLTYPGARQVWRGKEITWAKVHQRKTHSKVHRKLIWHNQQTASLMSVCVYACGGGIFEWIGSDLH